MAASSIAAWATHEDVSLADLQSALAEVREIQKLTAPNSDSLKAEYMTSTNTISRAHILREVVNYARQIPDGLEGGYLFVNGEPQLSRVLMRHVFANYLSQCDLPPFERQLAGSGLGLYLPTGKESPPLMEPGKLQRSGHEIPAGSRAGSGCLALRHGIRL